MYFVSKKAHLFIPLFLISAFCIWIILKAPLKETFEYNWDEGMDVMKASLYLKGFPLYQSIWSDQPPLFTVLLAFCFKVFGPSMYLTRIILLLFSSLLLFCLYQIIRMRKGNIVAAAGAILLTFSTGYIRLSVSVMIGTASLALAMFSLYLLYLYLKSNLRPYLLLSAIFLAFSVQIKFFTAFLIPLVVYEIIRTERKNRRATTAHLWWLASFLILYSATIFIFFGFNFKLFLEQLFQSHLKKFNLANNSPLPLVFMLLPDYDIVLLAIMGMIFSVLNKDSGVTLPLGWLILVSLILAIHRPIWYHYYLLISIPLCWLAAIGVSYLFSSDSRNEWTAAIHRRKFSFFALRWVTFGCIIVVLVNLPIKIERSIRHASTLPCPQQRAIVEELKKYHKKTRWIVTDMPAAAFYAHLLVPPEIAVASIKRPMDEDYFIFLLEKYRPEQILFGNLYKYTEKLMPYLQTRYSQDYQCVLKHETQNYVPYDSTLTCIWKPLGQYIPFKLLRNRNLYDLAWNRLSIPTFKMHKINHYYSPGDKVIKLFIRKDILTD